MTVNFIKNEQQIVHSKLSKENSIDRAITIIDNSIKRIATKQIKNKQELSALQAYRNEIKLSFYNLQIKKLSKIQENKFNKTVDKANKVVSLTLQKAAKNLIPKEKQGSLSTIKSSLKTYDISHYQPKNKNAAKQWEKTVQHTHKVANAKKGLYSLKGYHIGELLGLNKFVIAKHPSTKLPKTREERLHIYGSTIQKHFNSWVKSENKNGIPHYLSMSLDEYMKKHCLPKMNSRAQKEFIKNSVNYLDRNTRKNSLVTFKHSKAYNKNKSLKDGNYMFVLSRDWKMYIGKKKQGTFHHSSFLSGAPVRSAGMITVKNHKIVSVNSHSGHYKPSLESTKIIKKYLSSSKRLNHNGKKINQKSR